MQHGRLALTVTAADGLGILIALIAVVISLATYYLRERATIAAEVSNRLNKQNASAALLNELLREYRQPEMKTALELMGKLEDEIKRGILPTPDIEEKSAIAFWNAFKTQHPKINSFDDARRLIQQYYKHAYSLYDNDLLTIEQFRVVLGQAGINLFEKVVAPLSIGKQIVEIGTPKPGHFSWLEPFLKLLHEQSN